MRRRFTGAVGAFAAALALGACASGDLVVPEVAQSAQSSPNLDAARIDEALDEVSQVLSEADSSLDAEEFGDRIIAGAARTRAAQYAYARESGDTLPSLDLSAQNLAVTNSAQWPRAVLNIRQADASQLPVVEVFVQSDARAAYALTHWCRMLGGTSVTMPPIEQGSAFVTDNSTGFVSTPREALADYVEMLNAGQTSSPNFAGDEFTAQYVDTVKTLASSLEAAGTVTAKAAATSDPIAGVVLQDGSALVAANFTYTLTYSRTIAKSTMRLGGQTATMHSGDDDTVKGSARVTYVATVLMNIPSSNQGGVSRIVGADRVIESVEMDDSTNPDNA